jgi:phosphohistidine swiveling domain-containing protein
MAVMGATERGDSWDTLHDWSAPDEHWGTTNVRENLPGVATPLTWSVWRRSSENSTRGAAYAIGAFSKAERQIPTSPDEYYSRIFYGRYALKFEYLTTLGDRMPGTSGQDIAAGLLGRVPEDIVYSPTKRRYAVIAWKLPLLQFTIPRQVRRAIAETESWYYQRLDQVPTLDRDGAIATLVEAADHFAEMALLQTIAVVAVIQPLYESVQKLVDRYGVGDVGTLSGSGGAEVTGLVGDLWKASRGQIPLERVVRAHGFHGRLEGELSGRVWREDPTPLKRLLDDYAAQDDSQDPLELEGQQQKKRAELTKQLIAAAPAPQRPMVRLMLKLAAKRIPLRGAAKRSMLEGLDIARASARRAGELLADEGRLDDPDDVFYLTLEEVSGPWPADAKELVKLRRERRAEYQQLELPPDWTGMPEPIHLEELDEGRPDVISGIGVSVGVVEGVARIVEDPDVAEIEPDEILVAPTTNPSWSSIMFVSSGLVVDIGGALSHAAVVARELGLPCVVNTQSGSRVIKTGDRLRVDGKAGTVEILERAG